MSKNYYNPYLEDESFADLSVEDIEDEDARDVVKTVEAFIDGLKDWDILSDMREYGVPFDTYDDEELAGAIMDHVIMSLEADKMALISEIIQDEQ